MSLDTIWVIIQGSFAANIGIQNHTFYLTYEEALIALKEKHVRSKEVKNLTVSDIDTRYSLGQFWMVEHGRQFYFCQIDRLTRDSLVTENEQEQVQKTGLKL